MSMTAEEVSAVLTTWGNEKLLALKSFGKSITCHDITESAAHRLSLQTQYETRELGTVTAPAPPGKPVPHAPVLSKYTPEDSQKAIAAVQHVTASRSFTEGSHQVFLHETHRLTKCVNCAGAGRTYCDFCKGIGHSTCGFCGGMGMRNVMRPKQSRDYRGHITFGTEMVQVSCTCRGGRVPCSRCHGHGHINCPQCLTHGSVHEWDTVTHKFELRRDDLFFNSSELPDHIVKDAPSQPVWNNFHVPGTPLPEMPTPLKTQCQEVLDKAAQANVLDRQVLFQHLVISRIPIYFVIYSAGKTEKAHLWIYGTDRRVHAPSETGIRGLWNRFRR